MCGLPGEPVVVSCGDALVGEVVLLVKLLPPGTFADSLPGTLVGLSSNEWPIMVVPCTGPDTVMHKIACLCVRGRNLPLNAPVAYLISVDGLSMLGSVESDEGASVDMDHCSLTLTLNLPGALLCDLDER